MSFVCKAKTKEKNEETYLFKVFVLNSKTRNFVGQTKMFNIFFLCFSF